MRQTRSRTTGGCALPQLLHRTVPRAPARNGRAAGAHRGAQGLRQRAHRRKTCGAAHPAAAAHNDPRVGQAHLALFNQRADPSGLSYDKINEMMKEAAKQQNAE